VSAAIVVTMFCLCAPWNPSSATALPSERQPMRERLGEPAATIFSCAARTSYEIRLSASSR
jgi:hypothetical protein